MSKIIDATAEWIEEFGGWVVLLDRDEVDMSDSKPLRSIVKINDDPHEARLAWDAMVFCLADMNHGDARDEWKTFADKKAAERVAKQCQKSLKDIEKGKPPLTGMAAQIKAMATARNKGGRIPGYNIPPHMVGKILGA